MTPLLDELRTFLKDFAGTQRELLAALEAGWILRLLQEGAAERAIAASVIRKKIKSKKLVTERDALVQKLFAQEEA